MEKKLQRDEQHKMIAGVCAGLADYLSMDITLVRVIFVVVLVFHGFALIPYIVLWIVMPKKILNFNDPQVNYTVPPQPFGNPFESVPPQQPAPPFVMPAKKPSNAGMIVGMALVAFGTFFLLDEFDLLPDWNFCRLWPIIFVVAGLALVFSRKKANPWEKEDWHKTEEPTTEKKDDTTGDIPPEV